MRYGEAPPELEICNRAINGLTRVKSATGGRISDRHLRQWSRRDPDRPIVDRAVVPRVQTAPHRAGRSQSAGWNPLCRVGPPMPRGRYSSTPHSAHALPAQVGSCRSRLSSRDSSIAAAASRRGIDQRTSRGRDVVGVGEYGIRVTLRALCDVSKLDGEGGCPTRLRLATRSARRCRRVQFPRPG